MGGKAEKLIVIGAGVWGLACALTCARRGWQVAVFESHGVAAGASGGVVGAMAPHTPDQWNAKKQFQFDALDTAGAFWADIESVTGMATGFGRIGRVQPLPSTDARTLALSRIDAACRHWGAGYDWRVTDPDDAHPFGTVHDTLSARIHPARATLALAAACRAAGVVLHEGAPVTSLSQTGIVTPAGRHDAAAVIVAAGVQGFDLIAPHVPHRAGSGQKGQAAVLAADLRGQPQLYADGLYIVPHADGTTAIGSTSENSFSDPTATDAQLDALIDRARATLPALASAPVLSRWAGIRPKPRRRDPMLGPVPGLPRHFTALGAFKIGFGLAHKVSQTLADTLDGTGSIPESFTIARHME